MGKQWKQWQTLFWGAPKLLQMVTAAMKLKDACSLKKSCDQPAAAAKSCQSCPTRCAQQTAAHQARRPWESPGKNTAVGCHFLLQCRKVKSESQAAQLCPTLSDPMDCSLPGPSIHGMFQARVLEWVATAFSNDQPKQHIKKQRPCFADKGLSSQSYGFASSHVWIWDLDHKESWALLRVPWTARWSNQLILKESSPE